MGYQHIEVELRDHLALLWLNRPEKLNALSADMWDDIPTAMGILDADDGVRTVVVAGRGPAFTVGIDIALLAGIQPEGESQAAANLALYHTIRRLQRTATCLAESPKPVIAAIHGHCLGAGMDLATACDIRLAARDATFSIRETRMGLVADVGTLQRLPAIVGPGHTAELAFTGSDIDADRALRIGLVNDVFKITGPTFARTADVGNAVLPVLFGRDGNVGILIAFAMVPIAYFLIYRTTLGFEIRTVGANPSAARYAGMSPRRLIILTLSMCGLFAGLAGAIIILGPSLGYYPAVFGTTIGFAGITVALLGRSHPVGIAFAALLLGGMNAGAPAMQIVADIQREIIDVIQGLILLFLAMEVVIRRVLRVRAESIAPEELQTVSASYGQGSTT